DVGIDPQHLFSELRAEPARHADDSRQRADTERDAEHRKHRSNGDEGALLRTHVAQREFERKSHSAGDLADAGRLRHRNYPRRTPTTPELSRAPPKAAPGAAGQR